GVYAALSELFVALDGADSGAQRSLCEARGAPSKSCIAAARCRRRIRAHRGRRTSHAVDRSHELRRTGALRTRRLDAPDGILYVQFGGVAQSKPEAKQSRDRKGA